MLFIINASTIYVCFILVFFVAVLNTMQLICFFWGFFLSKKPGVSSFLENMVMYACSISHLELLPYLPRLN